MIQFIMVRCLPAQLVARGLLLLDTKEKQTHDANRQGTLDLGHLSKAHSEHSNIYPYHLQTGLRRDQNLPFFLGVWPEQEPLSPEMLPLEEGEWHRSSSAQSISLWTLLLIHMCSVINPAGEIKGQKKKRHLYGDQGWMEGKPGR